MRRIFFTLIIFSVAFISCKKTDGIIVADPGPNVQGSDYNAIAIGNKWEYTAYDTSFGVIDGYQKTTFKITISVTGVRKMFDGKDAFVFLVQKDGKTFDTLFKRLENGRVTVFESLSSSQIIETADVFNVPFTDGQSWAAVPKPGYGNTYFVHQKLDYNALLPFGTVFMINRENVPVEKSVASLHYIFKPFVGLVELDDNYFGIDNSYHVVWKLQHYVLN